MTDERTQKANRPTGDDQAVASGAPEETAAVAPLVVTNYTPNGAGSQSKLLQAAMAYADKFSWAVFPLRPGTKEPFAGTAGCSDATTDAQVIRAWWERWPGANVAIACGPSRLVVVDLDAQKGGEESWADLCQQHSIDDDTIINLTGGGGQHLVFAMPNGEDIRNNAGKLGDGIDVRANGGYIVAPPSIHPSGRVYAWDVGAHPGDRKPAPLPEALVGLLVERPQESLELPEMIPQGQRNDNLFRLACATRRNGATETEILAYIAAVNAERCDPPMSRAELEAIAESAATYQPEAQRRKTRRLGKRLTAKDAEAIEAITPEPPDPELRKLIHDTLVGAGYEARKKPSTKYRREVAGQMMLGWLRENGGFVQSETGDLYYFSHMDRRLYDLETDRWRAWLYALAGCNPAGTDYAYLTADCKATALLGAPTLPIVRVAAWDDDAQVLRMSRFDGTVYILDGETITEEANGQNVIFDDHPLWLPYEPDFSAPGALRWSTTDLPNWENNSEGHGLAFRAWIIGTFFCELCPTRPLLVFLGEKGSGKSMALRVLLRLLFGPVGELTGVPDKPDGFTAAAAAAHVLVLDNLDQFTPWLRDKLARISTGAEDQYRQLYTSKEVGRVRYRCWLAFTARTPDTLRRDDLADRLLLLPVERIGEPKPERDFLAQTIGLRNLWWGDVLTTLNAIVAGIRRGELASTSTLRMADWESLGRLVASGEDLGDVWTAFIEDLERAQNAFLLQGDLIVDALEEWLRTEMNHGREVITRELYEEWTAALFGEKKPPSDWPKSVRGLGMRLASARRSLQTTYRVEWGKDRTNKTTYRFSPLPREESA